MANPKKEDGNDHMENSHKERSNAIDQETLQERLGIGLRSMYRSVLEEPLPDDMMALLDQLDDTDDKADASD